MLFAFGRIEVIMIVGQVPLVNILLNIQFIQMKHRRHAHGTMTAEREDVGDDGTASTGRICQV